MGDGDTQRFRVGVFSKPTVAHRGAAHLIVLEGGNVGRRFVINDSVTVGRLEGVSIQIDDAKASRRHAIIRDDGRTWRVVDLGSQNGTWVNGERVQDVAITFGDRIQMGDTLFLFTHRDPLEERIRHRQKLEMLGRLGAGVAHDINNLLGSTLANAEMVATLVADGKASSSEVIECLDDIRVAAKRGAELTRRILDQARAGGSSDTSVDLTAVVHESVLLVRRTFDASVQMVEQVTPGIMVRGDRSALSQVVMNLLVNARDALAKGGRLDVRLTLADAATVMHSPVGFAGQHALLEVHDDGPGIPEAIQSRIFEPFFTTKPADRGSGLGLSTVADIVAEHGGRVSFESREGKGALFRVLLPALDIRSDKRALLTPLFGIPIPSAASLKDDDGRSVVLVVDDDALVRRSLVRVLTRDGHEVLEAEGGRQALELYQARRADVRLVLLDLDMPDLDGEATFKRLRDVDAAVAVVFLTGLCDDERRDSLLVQGARRLLTKPCDSELLRRTVREESKSGVGKTTLVR